jgi:alkyl sulfatase BDS1-like metallo-beta-lactamase superfamily hydrolase
VDNPEHPAYKGLIGRAQNLEVFGSDGRLIWSSENYRFLESDPPNSVNPNLWEHERLNAVAGLFKVVEGVYQLRGFDLANMTLIEGVTGWIVVDPLTSAETARAALDFAWHYLPRKPVKAILFTHSHIDHFGGSHGVATPKTVASESIRVVAPEGFLEAATSENVIAGVAMARRSNLMYGLHLPKTAAGQVGSGLGKAPVMGTFGILRPTEVISHTGQQAEIDGVKFIFQSVAESEAPSEFTFYLPHAKVLVGADLVARTQLNLYSLRGAPVRSALKWSRYIDEAIRLFPDATVLANGHNWPVWGSDNIRDSLEKQRDTYRFLHDQTVRLMNQGLTAEEIADQLSLPTSLEESPYSRGYYGTLNHNVKGIYQYYLGWFDGNPVNLNPYPLAEKASRYVALAGGAENLLHSAQAAFDAADYRWAAEILGYLVFAETENLKAKELLANTYQQLGFQAEAATWRNFYLGAAHELRYGAPKKGIDIKSLGDILANASLDDIFSSLAVRLNGKKAEGVHIAVRVMVTDTGEDYLLEVKNAVLHVINTSTAADIDADVTLAVSRNLLNQIITGDANITDLLFSPQLNIDGDGLVLANFMRLFDKPDGRFNIVIP